MDYVKYIDEKTIEYPPINKDGIINYNLDINQLTIDGYKQLVPVEKPKTTRKYEIHYINKENIHEYIYYLETEEEWQERLFQEAKQNKFLENVTKRNALDRIKCNFSATKTGYLLRMTPVGDLLTIVMGIALPAIMAQQPIPAGTLRYYDEEGVSHPTPKINANYVSTFYQSIVQSVSAIDSYSTDIEHQINEATTIEELEEIIIDYNSLDL